jgi:hypothetical protein
MLLIEAVLLKSSKNIYNESKKQPHFSIWIYHRVSNEIVKKKSIPLSKQLPQTSFTFTKKRSQNY